MSGIHVVPSDGEWKVRKTGKTRALRIFDSEGEAIFYVMNVKSSTILYCHDL